MTEVTRRKFVVLGAAATGAVVSGQIDRPGLFAQQTRPEQRGISDRKPIVAKTIEGYAVYADTGAILAIIYAAKAIKDLMSSNVDGDYADKLIRIERQLRAISEAIDELSLRLDRVAEALAHLAVQIELLPLKDAQADVLSVVDLIADNFPQWARDPAKHNDAIDRARHDLQRFARKVMGLGFGPYHVVALAAANEFSLLTLLRTPKEDVALAVNRYVSHFRAAIPASPAGTIGHAQAAVTKELQVLHAVWAPRVDPQISYGPVRLAGTRCRYATVHGRGKYDDGYNLDSISYEQITVPCGQSERDARLYEPSRPLVVGIDSGPPNPCVGQINPPDDACQKWRAATAPYFGATDKYRSLRSDGEVLTEAEKQLREIIASTERIGQ